MGMSTSVYGIKPADEKYKKMLKIYKLCEMEKISMPKEVEDFFEGETPDPLGVVIDLDTNRGVTAYYADMQEGFEVDLTKLPHDIKIIRFVNSY